MVNDYFINENEAVSIYIGYFTCPKCGKKNKIKGWKIKEGQELRIVFSAPKSEIYPGYRKMKFVCAYCGAEWELGIEKEV